MKDFHGGSDDKESAHNARDPDSILVWEDPLGEEMATHSSVLVGKFHGQRSLAESTGLQRVVHD